MWRAVANILPRAKVHGGRACCLPPAQKGRSLLAGTTRCRWRDTALGTCAAWPFSIDLGIQKVEALDEGHFVRVEWEDGKESCYPYVWPRDNCQCTHCFLHSARARKLVTENLGVNIVVKEVTLADRKKAV